MAKVVHEPQARIHNLAGVVVQRRRQNRHRASSTLEVTTPVRDARSPAR
jgi:hypothetical protein